MNNPVQALVAAFRRRYGRPTTLEPPGHNDAKWLTVRFFDKRWWVLRTCPCHQGEPVAAPYATEAEAVRCMHRLVSVSERLGT